MNEQERLDRIIMILSDSVHEMCYVEYRDDNSVIGADMDGVQTVAKEICNVFTVTPKDARSKRERKLDEQFAAMGVKPIVYHFTERALLRGAFKAITIATIEPKHKSIFICIEKNTRLKIIEQATHLTEEFNKMNVCGIAICDRRDVFNKRYGRMKAKGRLLQHLLKEAQKK